MRMIRPSLRRVLALLPMLLVASMLTPATAWADTAEDFSRTLRRIELSVIQVENHSAELRSMLRDPALTWESHSFEWTRIRERANDLAAELKNLQDHKLNSRLSNWERKAVNRISSRINAITQSAEDGIEFLNRNKNTTVLAASDQYSNIVTRIRDLADQVEDIVDYLKNRSEYEEEVKS